MQIKIPLPSPALDVENTIRSTCSHYGYPGAELRIENNELILHLTDVSPLPGPGIQSSQESHFPHVFC